MSYAVLCAVVFCVEGT